MTEEREPTRGEAAVRDMTLTALRQLTHAQIEQARWSALKGRKDEAGRAARSALEAATAVVTERGKVLDAFAADGALSAEDTDKERKAYLAGRLLGAEAEREEHGARLKALKRASAAGLEGPVADQIKVQRQEAVVAVAIAEADADYCRKELGVNRATRRKPAKK